MSDTQGEAGQGGFEELEKMLAAMFGPSMASDAVEAMRRAGVDEEQLAQMPGMADMSQLSPGQMAAMQAQMQQMFASMQRAAEEGESVNWQMASELAQRTAREHGDPIVTAAMAEQATQALQVADLWLDTATDFLPAPGKREAWSRSDWVERTLPVWKDMVAPVAEAVTGALTDVLTQQLGALGGAQGESDAEGSSVDPQIRALSGVMSSMAGAAFGLQLGQAIGELGGEALSATGVGLPLTSEPGTALVPAGVAEFAEGLEVDESEVRLFLAVREAATARLYAHVPWLRSQVLGAVQAYAREIRIDTKSLEASVAQVDPQDPEALRAAMESGLFSPQVTPAQKEAVERLETLLALVEGWVEVITARATAAQLPSARALEEMLRRRRLSGGAAEQVFARLIGLEFRPRRVREAAQLWRLLGEQVGESERDAFWLHPDVMPSAAELATPDTFLAMRRVAQDMDAQIDADLASLLDGTLGYAEGAQDADENKPGGLGD